MSRYESLQRLSQLPDMVAVLPGHNYGEQRMSRIVNERQTNPAMRCTDVAQFRVIAGVDPPPEVGYTCSQSTLRSLHLFAHVSFSPRRGWSRSLRRRLKPLQRRTASSHSTVAGCSGGRGGGCALYC